MEDAQLDALGRRGVALVAFAAAVTMMARLWEGGLFRDEVLYAAVAKQIIVRHEWLNLYLGDDPYWNKPPLLFWLAAAAYRVGGISTFTAKVFPALFGVGSCVMLYLLARRLTGERIALIAALVLATTPRYVRSSATFRLDPGVAFFTLCALLAYVRGATSGSMRDFVLAGLAWGLAVMTKGPFGLTAPYLFLIYLAVHRQWHVVATPRFLLSVAVGAAVCLPWHVYQVAHWGPRFLDVYVRHQMMDRVMGKLWHGPPDSYLRALVLDDWPWLAFLAIGTVVAVQRARAGDRGALYILAWAVGFLALLYASEGRRPRYLHQFYPAAAVLSAFGIDRVLPAHWKPKIPRAATGVFAAVALLLLLLPIRLHSDGAADVRALRPALDVLDPHGTTLEGFRSGSFNLRAACLFYLDRDLHSVQTIRRVPTREGALVLTHVPQAHVLEGLGFTRRYENPSYALLRRGAVDVVADAVDRP